MPKYWMKNLARSFQNDSSGSWGGFKIRQPGQKSYNIGREHKLGEQLQAAWIPLHADEETQAFQSKCIDQVAEYGGFRARICDLLGCLLQFRLSLTESNAILGIGDMFVLSTSQLRAVLRFNSNETSRTPLRRILDVGAGCGAVTERFWPLLAQADGPTLLAATETSPGMVKRLRERGFECFETPTLQSLRSQPSFDLVSILNVLDRCSRPLTLLHDAVTLLRPGSGLLLLAVVLPFDPFVEDGRAQSPPEENLDLEGLDFESASRALVDRHLTPLGLELLSFSRVPYLCASTNLYEPLLWLDDAIFVLRRVSIVSG